MGRKELTAAQKTVLVALETYADYRDGTNAHPGQSNLAEMCSLTTRAVQDALARGIELGLIECTAPANPRASRAAVYRLVFAESTTGTAVLVNEPITGTAVPVNNSTTGTAVRVNNSTTGTAVPVNNSITGTATQPSPEQRFAPPRQSPKLLGVLRNGGTSPEPRITDTHTTPPSRFCDAHPRGYRGKCPDCANARTAFEAWQADQAAFDVEIANAAVLANRHRRQLIANCELCDDFGRISITDDDDGGRNEKLVPCDHPPSARRAQHA
ncbi:hypothetical protein [Mycolicibacterium wolinskyi]|uniref:hypothetical protein n=1 Tax=Mycolicibacterium wolinskyi TaxID=59750 RepID=UPI003917A38A